MAVFIVTDLRMALNPPQQPYRADTASSSFCRLTPALTLAREVGHPCREFSLMAPLAALGDRGTLTPVTWPEAEQEAVPTTGFSNLVF